MERIVGIDNWVELKRASWNAVKTKIIQQESFRKAKLKKVMTEVDADADSKCILNNNCCTCLVWNLYLYDIIIVLFYNVVYDTILALMVLPYLVPDVRTSPTYEKIIYFFEVIHMLHCMYSTCAVIECIDCYELLHLFYVQIGYSVCLYLPPLICMCVSCLYKFALDRYINILLLLYRELLI